MPCETIYRGDEPVGHICRSSFTWRIEVRRPGYRKWEQPKGEWESYDEAFAQLCGVFASGKYKRGMVVGFPDNPYYEPHVACEIERKGRNAGL